MKIFKGVTLSNIQNNKQVSRKAISKTGVAYQLSLAFVVSCVTFFSTSSAYAVDRELERRTQAILERLQEYEISRSLDMARRRQEIQIQHIQNRQVENAIASSTEAVIEAQITAQQASSVETQTSGQRDISTLTLRDSRNRTDIDRDRIPELGNETETEVETGTTEEQTSGTDTGEDGFFFDSYDPGNDEEPTDISNDELVEDTEVHVADDVTSAVEDALGDNTAEFSFDTSDLQFEQTMTSLQRDSRILENIDEKNVWTSEWVIMADKEAKQILETEGYEFSNEEHLETFGSIIANVKAPASYDLVEDYQVVMDQLNKHDAVLDLNHVYTNIYTNATQDISANLDGLIPGDLMTIDAKGVRIGMVDTAVDTEHKFLQHANITQKHFTQDGRDPVFEHGTAVASVFSGSNGEYRGIINGAALYNASVFIEADESQSITTALSLMKGLNWLVQQDIKVINMSLAGPPNRLLQRGIQQLCEQGVIIVAAAGNDGPLAKPMYPAGYGCAVAVTAVDSSNKLYKRAVRGNHIDVAAYGVDIMAASNDNSISSQSGTSIAAPFVSAWIASQLPENGLASNWLDLALENCIDLGEKGIDPLYGKGLLPFNTLQLAKVQQFNQLEMILHR